jgi:hypothetical protein
MVDAAARQWMADLEARTENLMDLMANPEYFRLTIAIEDECDGEVGAGYSGAHLAELMANPAYFMGMKRLQRIVARELRDLLADLNLGIGTEAAFACARKIVMDRLAEPEVSIQEQLWAVLEEDEATQGTDVAKPLRAGVKSVIYQVMTEADWEAIVQAVTQSVHRHLIQQSQTPNVA